MGTSRGRKRTKGGGRMRGSFELRKSFQVLKSTRADFCNESTDLYVTQVNTHSSMKRTRADMQWSPGRRRGPIVKTERVSHRSLSFSLSFPFYIFRIPRRARMQREYAGRRSCRSHECAMKRIILHFVARSRVTGDGIASR
ncbi:hypothetical protein PUN28_009560 [Cardiocondyla obscurior]|uniref:Uncharacterized protein n=1 Tax=Cardiocondyla obscurior TaxID=286306 RepID=A0AAW2FYC2_9HYME